MFFFWAGGGESHIHAAKPYALRYWLPLCPPRRCDVVGIYTASCSRNTLGACAAGIGNGTLKRPVCLYHYISSIRR